MLSAYCSEDSIGGANDIRDRLSAGPAAGVAGKEPWTDALFRTAEINTARLDSFVLWTLMAAGILMLMDNHWRPCVSLVAGGIYLLAGIRDVVLVTMICLYDEHSINGAENGR